MPSRLSTEPKPTPICEAVTRPSMRFVRVRSRENQAALMRHKVREMLVSQRTQLLKGCAAT
jgi:transposase